MKVKIQIDTRTLVRFLLVITAFVGGIFIFWHLLPVLLIIAVSFFLAIALDTPVSRLAKLLPGHSRIFATALSYIVVVTILATFVMFVVPPVAHQAGGIASSLSSEIKHLSSSSNIVSGYVTRYHLKDILDQFVSGLQRQASEIASGAGSQLLAGVSTLVGGLITTLTVLVLTFMMLIEGPRWFEHLWNIYHNKALLERHQKLVRRMHQVVVSYVNGQVLVAALAALVTGAVLLLLVNFFSIPISVVLPLSMLIFFTTLIPMIGQTLGAIIIAIVLLFNDLGAALAFTAYFLIYQQIENNVIQPAVQSRTVELSALTVLVSVIIGIVLIGPAGGFLAVPAAGCIRVLLLDYLEHRKQTATNAVDA